MQMPPPPTSDPSAPLLACLGQDRHLVARCGCGRAAACDPLTWIAQGLGDQPLHAFSARLRCVCGARQAELEVSAGSYAASARPSVYVFR